MSNAKGDALTSTVADLLPKAFTGKCLGKVQAQTII
jgi:hypothetical protein